MIEKDETRSPGARRLFLAGASGAIGRRLAPLLIGDGWGVFGSTRSPDNAQMLREMGFEPVVVDVFNASWPTPTPSPSQTGRSQVRRPLGSSGGTRFGGLVPKFCENKSSAAFSSSGVADIAAAPST